MADSDTRKDRGDYSEKSMQDFVNRLVEQTKQNPVEYFEAKSLGDTNIHHQRRPRVLIGISGSVAAIKIPVLVSKLSSMCDVCVLMTQAAYHFVREDDFPSEVHPILSDEKEWYSWTKVGDPVIHILLRQWADVMIVAPLSANTLAKIANGLCDNLLTSVARAWDFNKPFVVAPAMNTFMWESPFTEMHLSVCRNLGIDVIDPIAKRLACGDIGTGAMAEPLDIIKKISCILRSLGFSIGTQNLEV